MSENVGTDIVDTDGLVEVFLAPEVVEGAEMVETVGSCLLLNE